jgi:hypothetical protein
MYYPDPNGPQVQGYDLYPVQEDFKADSHLILADDDLKKALIVQIEYYFSDANLAKG